MSRINYNNTTTTGETGASWDLDVGARLERLGCSARVVKHHLHAGSRNHVAAAYEVLLSAERSARAAPVSAGASPARPAE